MSEVKLFKSSTIRSLFDNVEKNIEKYRNADFSDLLHDSNLFLGAACNFSIEASVGLTCTATDDNEIACCLAIFNTLPKISASLARDERLWVRLTHIEFCKYARTRWKIPADNTVAVAHVRRHFFARGARGIERDNAISRLWWMTEICKRVDGLSLEESLKAFLFQSDVRASIVERPTTSQNSAVLSAVINELHKSLLGDKSLYKRESFRDVMKHLNVEGGTRLLEVLTSEQVGGIVKRLTAVT